MKLQSDTKIQIDIKRIMMRNKRSGRCASGNAVQYRRFYLHKFAAIQIAADFPNDLRAFFKYAAYLRINDQINIALAVTRVQIPQAMALLRKRLERFGQERNFFCFYGNFTRFCFKYPSADSDDIADIICFKILIGLAANRIALDINLEKTAFVLDMEKACFPHNPLQHNPSRHRNNRTVRIRFFLFRITVFHVLRGMCHIVFCDHKRVLSGPF